MPLYARCGITEVWVVDVNERAIHVFRDPGPEAYGATYIARPGQSVACVVVPEAGLDVGELFTS